jgi:RNA polymerase sigma factor (sigma-70 family)
VTADADLVARCKAGDARAMRDVVERFQQDVFGICYRLLRHTQDSEDVAQEVFVRVFRSLHRWDGLRPLRPWIIGIAVNRCRTAMGKRVRRPETVDYLAETAAAEEPKDDAPEVAQAIRTAVDALRNEYREVFVLFHEAGQSYEEIAAAVERPVGTVKTWLHRARGEILAVLKNKGLVPSEQKT